MLSEELRRAAERIAAEAPPLTPEQRARLRGLFAGMADPRDYAEARGSGRPLTRESAAPLRRPGPASRRRPPA